jgi:hypothetical protein
MSFEPFELQFTELSLIHPYNTSLYTIPHLPEIRLLDLLNIHEQLNLSCLVECIQLHTLSFQSDGRLLDDTGIVRAVSFDPLIHVPSLRSLHFYGPWLQSMVDVPLNMISKIQRLSFLTSLLIDLDYQRLGSKVILNLFASLPHLKSFGRLGRVDKSFWRECPKASGRQLESLVLGMARYTLNSRFVRNPDFLSDLAMGVLWFAPSIKHLEIWMGFQAEEDHLYDALARIKEGPSWPLDSDVHVKQLQTIDIYQMLDISNLDDRAWKRLAEIPWSMKLQIRMTRDDSFRKGFYKRFGL